MYRTPFDWRNPIGYLVAVTMQYVMIMYLLSTVGCALVFAIASYLFSIAMSKSIKLNLCSINRKAGDEIHRMRLMEQLVEFIEYHSRVKQLSIQNKQIEHSSTNTKSSQITVILRVSSDFSAIYQHIITTLFVWSLSSICVSMLMIQTQLVSLNL